MSSMSLMITLTLPTLIIINNNVCVVKVMTSFIPSNIFLSTPQLVKLCSGMIEAGKAYVSANKLFVNGIRDLSQQCKKDEMISVRF